MKDVREVEEIVMWEKETNILQFFTERKRKQNVFC